MKVQYRIPPSVTGKKEENYCFDVKSIFRVARLYFRAKKAKAVAFYVWF